MNLRLLMIFALSYPLLVSTAHAQLLTDPSYINAKSENQYAIYLGSSSTDYDLDKAGTGDINRSLVSATAARGFFNNLNLYASAAYGFDVEDGTGYELALGAKGNIDIKSIESMGFNWFTQLSVFSEELEENNDITVDNTLSELLLGIVAVKPIDQNFRIYAGLEVIASSIGEAVSKKEFLDDFKSDFERDARLGLKLGAIYKSFQFHMGLLDESSFLLGVSLPFQAVSFSLPDSVQSESNTETESKELPVAKPDVAKPVKPSQPKVIELDIYNDKPVPLSKREKLRLLQKALKREGYKPGVADGLMGKRTRNALRKFQKDNALKVTGKPSIETYKAMGIDE